MKYEVNGEPMVYENSTIDLNLWGEFYALKTQPRSAAQCQSQAWINKEGDNKSLRFYIHCLIAAQSEIIIGRISYKFKRSCCWERPLVDYSRSSGVMK